MPRRTVRGEWTAIACSHPSNFEFGTASSFKTGPPDGAMSSPAEACRRIEVTRVSRRPRMNPATPEKPTMKFMLIVKATKDTEMGAPPDPGLLEAIGKL